MRRICIICCICLLNSFSSISQNYGTGQFTFCKQTGETLTLQDLKKCPELVSKNKKLEVKSYVVAIFSPLTAAARDTMNETSTDMTGVYFEYKISGTQLTDDVLNYFEEHRNAHLQITIDDVIASDKGKEGKYEGFVFYLH